MEPALEGAGERSAGATCPLCRTRLGQDSTRTTPTSTQIPDQREESRGHSKGGKGTFLGYQLSPAPCPLCVFALWTELLGKEKNAKEKMDGVEAPWGG